jgi:hypothetical protein
VTDALAPSRAAVTDGLVPSEPAVTDALTPEASATTGTGDAATVSAEQARAIAVRAAGGGRVTKVERDTEHGRAVWDVEVRDGAVEHDIDVDRRTGAVLRHETDRDDDASGRDDRAEDRGGDRGDDRSDDRGDDRGGRDDRGGDDRGDHRGGHGRGGDDDRGDDHGGRGRGGDDD